MADKVTMVRIRTIYQTTTITFNLNTCGVVEELMEEDESN